MNLSFADTSVAMVQGFFGPAPEKGDQTLGGLVFVLVHSSKTGIQPAIFRGCIGVYVYIYI